MFYSPTLCNIGNRALTYRRHTILLSLINHVYYYHPLFSMDVLTNTWTGNLVKVVIPRPDPSGAPVAGVGKVSSCQLLNLLIAFGLLSQLTSILIHELALRCRCFWNMQMWKDRPKRRRACTGGSLVETRWSLCSTPRTSSTQSSMMDEVRKPMLELPEDKFTAEQYD